MIHWHDLCYMYAKLILLMNFKALLLSLSAVVVCAAASAQDRIIKMNGTSVEAKVIEIDSRVISYNKADNINGPVYKIAKSDVEKIEYKNGTEEVFNRRRTVRDNVENEDYGNNVIAFAPMQLNNGGVGVGLSYERLLDKNGIIAFYLPVTVSFRSEDNISIVASQTKDIYTYFFMPGIKIYPTGGKGKVRYGIGPSLAFAFDQDHQNIYLYDNNGMIIGQDVGYKDRFTFGLMINNSLNINPIEHLYLGLEMGLGFRYYESIEGGYNTTGIGSDGEPLVQFGFKAGYRF